MFAVASVRVCLSVCNALTFKSLDPESLFLVCNYIFRILRSSSYIKVVGSRSGSQGNIFLPDIARHLVSGRVVCYRRCSRVVQRQSCCRCREKDRQREAQLRICLILFSLFSTIAVTRPDSCWELGTGTYPLCLESPWLRHCKYSQFCERTLHTAHRHVSHSLDLLAIWNGAKFKKFGVQNYG